MNTTPITTKALSAAGEIASNLGFTEGRDGLAAFADLNAITEAAGWPIEIPKAYARFLSTAYLTGHTLGRASNPRLVSVPNRLTTAA